jgi:two-component system, response regulator PdtaR
MVVLIVEDEPIIAYCSAATLEDAGHVILGPAHSAAAALELARKRRPDVALIDIDLEIPGAGIGLAQQLRTHYGTAIVFATGRIEAARGHSDLAFAVLSKPYDPAELPAVIGSATGAVRRTSARTTPSRVASFSGIPAHNGSGA